MTGAVWLWLKEGKRVQEGWFCGKREFNDNNNNNNDTKEEDEGQVIKVWSRYVGKKRVEGFAAIRCK